MTDINVFNVTGECPKCGSRCDEPSVTTEQTYDANLRRWVDSKRIIAGNISTTFVKLVANAQCLCGRKDSVEHLHQKCLVCGFYWSTKTLEQSVE
jgi:hypothetical protein